MTAPQFDGVLFVGFGGPTPGCCERYTPCPGNEAVCFVKAIIGERPGAQARLAEVAAHYGHLGGFSPFNALTFQQAHGVAALLKAQGWDVPVRVGMRYWPPYVHDVLHEMVEAGARNLLAVILSPFQCTASWEAYQQVVTEAVTSCGTRAPRMTYLAPWPTHADFIEAIVATVRAAATALSPAWQQEAVMLYTAHSIPASMASTAPYTQQFAAAAAAASARLGVAHYRLAYQSQATGTPFPWLQPDINDAIQHVRAEGYREAIVAPIGFLCDHVEVLYDLDIQARETAQACGLTLQRAATVGMQPAFLGMLSTLLGARLREG
ncbi:MAG: ferrochelatase [Candidatus Tectomicrobia bacterium]|uniref:Ferrochelatase n=1 Tax=Tectimicrobiota bacterium TaxID=2528274 RepID=A0A937VWN7_UNCTE|nr:ferrochelatase [Candidatus Tectomicrobia bacterium]